MPLILVDLGEGRQQIYKQNSRYWQHYFRRNMNPQVNLVFTLLILSARYTHQMINLYHDKYDKLIKSTA